ncbi:fluoride efflux transporter FluC [Streptomyces lanatus]|uniref:Fluoride-specific ion channel n=1 Tax=Streptomyces lanatus TaxID=66900 RepID=A0ABV1Y4I2_9ACTN|nr:CrcB family protein [Streptomyces lanatus]
MLLMVGGVAGTVLRFSMEKGVLRMSPASSLPRAFPRAQFAVNFAGCFALGVLLGKLIRHDLPATYYVLLGGVITAFSIFSLQLVELTQSRLYGLAGLRAFTGWLVGTGAAVVGVVVSMR